MPLVAAAAIGAAATIGTSVYSTKRAGDINEQSIAAQRASDARAQALEEERLRVEQAEAEKDRVLAEQARKDELAFNQQRWSDYVASRQPYVQASQAAYANLLGLMRGGGAGQTAAAATIPSTAPTGGVASTTLSQAMTPTTATMSPSRGATATRAAFTRMPMTSTPMAGAMTLQELMTLQSLLPGSKTAGVVEKVPSSWSMNA